MGLEAPLHPLTQLADSFGKAAWGFQTGANTRLAAGKGKGGGAH